MYHLKPQVSAITEAAMRGEIDFAESLRRRVALLEGLEESALQRVYDERLQLSPGAEIMLGKLKEHGIKTLLVSGGFIFFSERLRPAWASTMHVPTRWKSSTEDSPARCCRTSLTQKAKPSGWCTPATCWSSDPNRSSPWRRRE